MLAVHEAERVYAHNYLSLDNYSFTPQERLHTASQHQRVFNQADKSSSESFIMLFRENNVGFPRTGVVVAKRKAKRAVDRNLIKRIVRDSFRLNKTKLPSYDFIVILKSPITKIRRDKLRKEITILWQSFA